MRRLALVTLAGLALSAPSTSSSAVRLTVMPKDSLIDAPARVTVSGLAVHEQVTLTATTVDFDGAPWEARATVRADAHGVADLARARSALGTYTGRDPMGLFWSMLPVGFHGRANEIAMAPADIAPVRFAVRAHGRTLARATVIRRVASSDVSVTDVTLEHDGLIGHFCSKPSTTPRTAILKLGGSEGGVPGTSACRLLASHGYPTLALAYFGVAGLPPELMNVPLEYFRSALEWLAREQGVDPKKLVVMGTSRGGEAALLIGSVFPALVHGVVGYVPSAYVYPAVVDLSQPAWTLNGEPIPFFRFDAPANDGALIRVERINGPVFVVGGVLDGLWPSATFVRQIADRMHLAGRTDVTALTYYAGHAIGIGVPYLRDATVGDTRYGRLDFGGTPAADARARADAWPKLLAFLRRL